MKKLSIFSMLIAAFLVASCDRNIPGGETPVGDATLSVKVAGTQATRALVGTDATANAVTINDLTVFVFNTDGNLVAMDQASSDNKVVDLPLFSGIAYNIFVIGNKKDLDLSGIDSQSELLALYTEDLDDQEDINGATLSPTVTGYFMGATMSTGKNYLGYASGVTGNKLDGDNLFYVHRLISRVYLSSITNNNPDLTITAINILNAKSKSMLFPSNLSGNNNSTDGKEYYNIAFPEAAETTLGNFTQVGLFGYYWNFTSFAHGTLANNEGGTRFPRLYKNNSGDDITATVADATLKTLTGTNVSATTDPLRYEVSGSPEGGNDISNVAFYLFANDNNPGDHATILLIEGTVGATTVYYPIVINAAGHGTISADEDGEENTYIKRNRQYEITATIADGSDGYTNPWLDVTATLDVQVTISNWVATITQDVTF